jgi:hypothetical protein
LVISHLGDGSHGGDAQEIINAIENIPGLKDVKLFRVGS